MPIPRLTPPLATDGVGPGSRQSRHLGHGKAPAVATGDGWPKVAESPFPGLFAPQGRLWMETLSGKGHKRARGDRPV